MKASAGWLSASMARFSAGEGRTGCAHLRQYSAFYREWGEGEPLILVPGLAGGYELLGPLARLLSPHYRVISYKLRGEDNPFALRQQFGIPELVDDLGEFVDWMQLERPSILGVSFGGILAVEYAARHAARVHRLVVQGVGAHFERTLLQRVAGLVLSSYPLPSDSNFVNQFFNLLFGGRQERGPLFDFVTRRCWSTDQSVMAHRFRLAEEHQLNRRLSQVRSPSLILAGERDLLVSHQSLASLHSGLRGSQLVQLKGAGHLAFATQPERIATEVRQFLEAN